MFCASEGEKWLTARHTARKSARMLDRWIYDTANKGKVIFVLWVEPLVSFKKEIAFLARSTE
jgi:hypothetical protein